MTRKQIEKMAADRQRKLNEKIESVKKMFIDSNLFDANEMFVDCLCARLADKTALLPYSLYDLCAEADDEQFDFEKQFHFIKSIEYDLYDIRSLAYFQPDRYIDSDPVHFDGDIIITDPCYLLSRSNDGDDWQDCDYGEDLGKIGLKHWMSRDTIYGDWSCTTYNKDTKEVLGNFCADSGMVCVADLNEVLSYNPDFDYHIAKPWTTTLIKNFSGTVRFIVRKYKSDFYVEVKGTGVNTETKEPLNFITQQTGF